MRLSMLLFIRGLAMSDNTAGLEADLNGALRKIEELETLLNNLIQELEWQVPGFYFPHSKR